MQAGEFSYIVRSVHELLQTEFGLADGLADTATWGEMVKKHPRLKLPPLTDEPGEKRTVKPDEPFVQILDPATGTATFPVEVIDVIYRHLEAKWKSGTGITHRRMRESLKSSFADARILDLHGSTKKLEVTPDGKRDENVFDIQQGVGISLFINPVGAGGNCPESTAR